VFRQSSQEAPANLDRQTFYLPVALVRVEWGKPTD
jgi:hypothetical protein